MEAQTSMFLSTDEIAELTGRKRKDCQVKALRHMGIEHRIRPNGTVAVLRSHVERELGGATTTVTQEIEPNWSAME